MEVKSSLALTSALFDAVCRKANIHCWVGPDTKATFVLVDSPPRPQSRATRSSGVPALHFVLVFLFTRVSCRRLACRGVGASCQLACALGGLGEHYCGAAPSRWMWMPMGERAKSQRGEMDSCSSDDESDVSATDNMKPTTLAFDINELLNDEEVADINLIPENNADDTQIRSVPAIKAILAARSKVFKRMLYGEFRETSQSNNDEGITTIRLDYSGRVLQLLVEFCFTDKLSSLHNSSEGRTASLTLEGKCRLLTNLSGAAHYFDIPKLELDIQDLLKNYMNEYPSLACAILDQSSQMLSGENLGFIAMDKIRARPKSALLQAKITTAPPGGCVSP
ncbi:hypothetical protein THAOC_16695, partial [Thalassiosira oceanica]